MKFLLLLILILNFTAGEAQHSEKIFKQNNSVLIAQNDKHSRAYKNGKTVKIHYHYKNSFRKAKGRISIVNENEIQIIPYGKKHIISINPDSIISIGIWLRTGKIITAVSAGLGIASISLAALGANNSHYDSAGNIIFFGFVMIALVELYYVGISIPVILLRELISKRSDKKGYHFYVKVITSYPG